MEEEDEEFSPEELENLLMRAYWLGREEERRLRFNLSKLDLDYEINKLLKGTSYYKYNDGASSWQSE